MAGFAFWVSAAVGFLCEGVFGGAGADFSWLGTLMNKPHYPDICRRYLQEFQGCTQERDKEMDF